MMLTEEDSTNHYLPLVRIDRETILSFKLSIFITGVVPTYLASCVNNEFLMSSVTTEKESINSI